MKYIFLIGLIPLLFSCENKTHEKIPLVNVHIESNTSFEHEINELKENLLNINIEEVKGRLTSIERVKFSNRLDDFRESLNEITLLVKKDYSPGEVKAIKEKLSQTKVIWEYILNKYKI